MHNGIIGIHIASIGVRGDSVEPLSSNARSSVATWVGRNATSENASVILDFILTQRGRFQGEMLTGIARVVPDRRLSEMAKLMRSSRHNLVRHGCFKIISYQLNAGKGICGVDDFSHNPGRYLDRAEALLKANGFAGAKER